MPSLLKKKSFALKISFWTYHTAEPWKAFVPLLVISWKLPPPDRPVDASYMLVWSFTSSSVSGAGAMLLERDPSFEVRFVASIPLNERLVLVVRVPLTE